MSDYDEMLNAVDELQTQRSIKRKALESLVKQTYTVFPFEISYGKETEDGGAIVSGRAQIAPDTINPPREFNQKFTKFEYEKAIKAHTPQGADPNVIVGGETE